MVEEKKFWKRDEVQWFVLRLKWKPVEVLEELLKAEGKETFVPRSYVLRTDSRGRKHRVLKKRAPGIIVCTCFVRFPPAICAHGILWSWSDGFVLQETRERSQQGDGGAYLADGTVH